MKPVFPTAYFGSIAYFRELIRTQKVQIEAQEHFVKQTIRTRCDIQVSNGLRHLSVPISKKNGNKTVMKDIEISYTDNWQNDHWRTIESAYASSPFFEHYCDEVKQLIFSGEKNLLRLNRRITEKVLEWLSIENLKVEYTKEFSLPSAGSDFRHFPFDDRLSTRKYHQVFEVENGFIPNLSILDLIMNEGPMARRWFVESAD
jgi:hypothetical protein